ncbi:MAG: TrkH family potassium uptake protein [Pseudomonadota bacterium]
MHFGLIARLLGILIGMFSVTMLVPMLVGLYFNDGNSDTFFTAFAITLLAGLLIWYPVRNTATRELSHRGGFLITALFWVVLSSFGTIPFLLSHEMNIDVTSAFFEAVSGLTSTGGTAITGLDDLPKSILYYRQQLQWLGGIGIIVITVAILPILGIGGMQLYRAEIPGPNKDEKITPRITGTAKWIFSIYSILTVACALAYWWAGMSLFDAISHSFSTVSAGGFSTHDASMGYFDNNVILYIASFFMLISALSFTLHYYAMSDFKLSVYWEDSESKFFLCLLAFCCAVAFAGLLVHEQFISGTDAAIHGVFQVISIFTTTGFASTDFANWPSFLPTWLILLACIGGCAGSVAGGMKVLRSMIIFKQGTSELFLLVHPQAVNPIKIKQRVVPPRVISAIWSFIAIYFYVFAFILITLMVTGLDFHTAFSATIGSLNNLGVGIEGIASSYADINIPAKWVLCLGMLLGRLEIFTLLVLFTPEFWRK